MLATTVHSDTLPWSGDAVGSIRYVAASTQLYGLPKVWTGRALGIGFSLCHYSILQSPCRYTRKARRHCSRDCQPNGYGATRNRRAGVKGHMILCSVDSLSEEDFSVPAEATS
jgi:hypothetical protein